MHKGLTFSFSFSFKYRVDWAGVGVGNGDVQRVKEGEGEWEWVGEAETKRGVWESERSDRWGWEGQWVSGSASASVTVTLREWEKERVSERVGRRLREGLTLWLMRESEIGESVKFKIFLLEIECLRLGFTFSKPSLRDSISKWQNSTWCAHVELEFLRLEFHVDTPRGIRPLDRQKPSLRGSSLGLEIEPLRRELLLMHIVSKPGQLTE